MVSFDRLAVFEIVEAIGSTWANVSYRRGLPIYLIYPLIATFVFTFSALFLKNASVGGVKPLTPVFVANLMAAVLFSGFWMLGGQIPSVYSLWQPAFIALFYIAGQTFILSAIGFGDVSVAAPVASSKVIIVPLLLALFTSDIPTVTTWCAAGLATLGVVLINYIVPKEGRSNVFFTASLAFGAAFSFASFDVCINFYSPAWDTGRLVPITYWFVGLFSFALIPLIDHPKKVLKELPWRSLMMGSFLLAAQACFLVYSISKFQDAARINVVYSLRGLWGVVFAWLLADWFGGREGELPKQTMIARLCGASLLVGAVIITILETRS